MKKKNILAMVLILVIASAAWFLTQPFLFGQTKNGFIFIQYAPAGTPVTLCYRHSVMKTQLWEYLFVNENADGLIMKSTKYQSYGAGLPCLTDQGNFKKVDGWFVLDDVNRPFPTLSIRNGVTNNGVLTVGDKSYDLPALMPLGTELHMYVAPLWKGCWMKKEIH